MDKPYVLVEEAMNAPEPRQSEILKLLKERWGIDGLPQYFVVFGMHVYWQEVAQNQCGWAPLSAGPMGGGRRYLDDNGNFR